MPVGVVCVCCVCGGCVQDFWASSSDPPPPDRPKFRSFFLSPAENFILSSLSGRSSRGILVVFLTTVRVWSSLVVL